MKKQGESYDTPIPPRCARVAAGVGFGLHSQWVRAGAEEQRPGLPGAVPWGPFRFRPAPRERAIPPSSSTSHPCVVKGGAKHRVEEGGGHGHSRFTRHAEDDPAAEAEA
jgi:hypothetical protein